MTTFTYVNINTSNWMRSAEIAEMSMQSPTGRTIHIQKKDMDKLNEEDRLFIHNIAGLNGSIKISIDYMERFKRIYDFLYNSDK